jgi:DNA-binding transcriptional LysR family regulator
LELRQLRAFLQVANTRHFGQAAAVLKITQPALTQRIQALERELGVQLLTRSAREVRLTPAGEVLLPYADSLVHIEDRALRDLAENAAGRKGTLRISYLLYGDVGLQGRIVAEFRRRYPAVEVATSVASAIANLELLKSGAVDAAFLGPVEVPAEIDARTIGLGALALALPEAHPLAKADRVPVSSLRGVPMIIWPQAWNPTGQSALIQWLARQIGTQPNITAEEPPDQALEVLLADGSAVTFVSAWRASSGHVPGIAFRPTVPELLVRHLIGQRRDDPSPLPSHLMRVAEEIAGPAALTVSKDAELL